jgi:hypothetical protein
MEAKKWMRKCLFVLGVILIFLTSFATARAQATLVLDNLRVDIWPEYDQPEALIIYRIFLAPGASLPASMTLRIPTDAGEPFNVAVRDPDGMLYTVAYTRTIQGEWSSIQFTSTSNEVQVEYYDPNLTRDGARRAFTYAWPGDYAVNSLAIQVQQPIGASDMRISPSLGSGRQGEDGLVYYTALVGAVPADTPFSISLNYEKPNEQLSVEVLRVEAAGPIDERTAGRRTVEDFLPWALGGLGLLLIGGGAWWYWQSDHNQIQPVKRKRHLPVSPKEAESEDDEASYCPQCGKRANLTDIFCRACGTRLRKDNG